MSGHHDHPPSPSNGFEELLRLQSSFQQSLTDATMNYLRQLQGLVGPVTPGTGVKRTEATARAASLAPGGRAELKIRVENRQRVHAMVTPMLTPLVLDNGTTWFAEAGFSPPTTLLATNDVATFTLALSAPADMPLGTYRGAILIYGASDGVIPLEVTVARSKAPGGSKRAGTTDAPAPAGAEAAPAPRARAAAKPRTKATASASAGTARTAKTRKPVKTPAKAAKSAPRNGGKNA